MLQKKDNNPNLNLKLQSQKLLEFSDKYGLNNIPDEELSSIGYQRMKNGSVVRLDVIKEREDKKAEEKKKKQEAEERLREKSRNAPLKNVKTSIDSAEVLGRRLGDYEVMEIIGNIEYYDFIFDDINIKSRKELYPEREVNLAVCESSFEKFLLESGFNESEVTRLSWDFFVGDQYLMASDNYERFSRDLDFESYVSEDGRDDSYYVSSEASTKIINVLQHSKAKYSDIEAMKRDFLDNGKEDFSEWAKEVLFLNDNDDEKNSDKFYELMDSQKNNNMGQFECFILHKYFASIGFDKIAGKIEKCNSLEELRSEYSKLKSSDLPSHDEHKMMLKKLQEATSVDQKKELSQQKKQIDQKKKEEGMILAGMRNIVFPEEEQSKKIQQIINKLINQLSTSTDSKESDEYYFNGQYDHSYDENPGIQSGDCTEGRPLPFDDPDVPAYNIKIFNGDKEHLGNIYLVETSKKEGKTKKMIWHLDALQINGKMDWNSAVEKIVSVLKKEAEIKGVDAITVNNKRSLISNYDYIQDAVLEYMRRKELTKCLNISLPHSEHRISPTSGMRYSNFQCEGEARVLWQKDEKSQ